jgi:hypothetical protein
MRMKNARILVKKLGGEFTLKNNFSTLRDVI